jgi:hypothetical protein
MTCGVRGGLLLSVGQQRSELVGAIHWHDISLLDSLVVLTRMIPHLAVAQSVNRSPNLPQRTPSQMNYEDHAPKRTRISLDVLLY